MDCSKCGTKMDCTDDKNSLYMQMQGEEYVCPKCGHYFFLDYDEIR
jgi:DNA-directed RNA polymerase subunit RPC12/RpoP